MTSTDRLVEIAEALDSVGVRSLVMGGHAVRYYGLERNTVDFDFQLASTEAASLAGRLSQTGLFRGGMLREETTWRRSEFRRFQIGVLPSGKEEWLEFWLSNHLLAPFEQAYARGEQGWLLRRNIHFLSLPDLIRSKETERDEDWRDVLYLEEVLDERQLRAASDELGRVRALAGLRSRRGFETALLKHYLSQALAVDEALRLASHPVTLAWLFPYASAEKRRMVARRLESSVEGALSKVAPASPRHLALVEAVRIAYQRAAKAADREDKRRHRPA